MNTSALPNLQQLDDITVNGRHDDTLRDILEEEVGTEVEELNLICKSMCLLSGSQTALGNEFLDIETYPVNDKIPDGVPLTSDIQKVLNLVYDIVGGNQLARSKNSCTSSWLLDRAMNKEVDQNWKDAVMEIDERKVENMRM